MIKRFLIYIKENGIGHVFEVIYRYKLDIIVYKIFSIITQRRPLENIIMIESHNDFDSNGGAFYNYLIEKKYNQKYKIVWLIKNNLPIELPYNVECVPLFNFSLKKDYYRCVAKYILGDCFCVPKTRKDQISIYCTHGPVGLKNTRGKIDLPENLDYCLTPSENYAPTYAYLHEWEYPCSKMIYVGYPMHDVLYKKDVNELSKITDYVYKKVFLWMPTFRVGNQGRNDSTCNYAYGIPLIQTLQEYEKLNEFLRENDSLLVIKIHPVQDINTLKITDKENIKILTGKSVKEYGIDNYRLMSSVDALISDYSSVAYDFLHCNKPIAYMHDDEKEYKLGYIVDDPHTMMAGNEIFTYDDFLGFFESVISGKDEYAEQREELLRRIFKYQDGNSCKRLAEFMQL